jgi:hypothetical protein
MKEYCDFTLLKVNVNYGKIINAMHSTRNGFSIKEKIPCKDGK